MNTLQNIMFITIQKNCNKINYKITVLNNILCDAITLGDIS